MLWKRRNPILLVRKLDSTNLEKQINLYKVYISCWLRVSMRACITCEHTCTHCVLRSICECLCKSIFGFLRSDIQTIDVFPKAYESVRLRTSQCSHLWTFEWHEMDRKAVFFFISLSNSYQFVSMPGCIHYCWFCLRENVCLIYMYMFRAVICQNC